MRVSMLVLAVVLSLPASRIATAAPHALYNPTTGNVKFVKDNDDGEAMVLTSRSGSLTGPTSLLDVPGSFHDGGTEFPFGYFYVGLKRGTWDTGNTVVPHTPVDDLVLEYFHFVLTTPSRGEIIVVPEPAALTLIAVGLTGIFWRRATLAPAGSSTLGRRRM